MVQKLALIGFGGVGQGLAQIIHQKQGFLKEMYDFEARIVAISDVQKGSLYNPQGLDIEEILNLMAAGGELNDYPNETGLVRGLDSMQTIRDTNADTIVEVTYTNIETGQPAIDHCKAAFESGKNVVTTNKGPVALMYKELSGLAKENKVEWGIEGTVMSGTPSLRMPFDSLSGNDILEIRGILNGTTNYILTRMEEGLSYNEALLKAQKLGYAEADPTSDVEGYDILYKVMILASVMMKKSLNKHEIHCQGISHFTSDDIQQAKSEGKRWKMIARLKKEPGGEVAASVKPEKMVLSDPLASVMGALNAITYECDLLGPVTIIGAGAGIKETGFSLLIDLMHIEKTNSRFDSSFTLDHIG